MVSVDGGDEMATTSGRATALACVRAGIDAARPARVVADAVRFDGERLRVADACYDLGDVDRIVVVGGGKAAGGVATALERLLGDRIDAGAVVTPNAGAGAGADGRADRDGETPIERHRGAHPVPDRAGMAGAERVRDLAAAADEGTLVLAVVTGGGSALLPAPAADVPLADLRVTTEALLDAGAAVDDLNAVRKHCSTLKGGGLASVAAPATVVGLLFSDVVGDDHGVIASGPTAPDDSTFAGALAAIDRYGVDPPSTIRRRLERGAAGDRSETPGPAEPIFDRVTNHVLANAFTAVAAARSVALDRGYDVRLLSTSVRGEAREAAPTHVAVAEEVLATGNPVERPAVVLSGGEVTATVRGDGVGGPNAEFALAAAIDLPAAATLACVDTDGRDGSTGFAGALVDAATVDDDDTARAALANSDAFGYLDDRGATLSTGATGTNVNDLRVLVVE